MELKPREVILDQWLAALESGSVPQSTGRLRTDTGFCCLGVLCEVAGLKAIQYVAGFHYKDAGGADATGALPPLLARHMGMKVDGSFPRGLVPDASIQDSLAAMNDGYSGSKRHTFKEIAAFIRKNHDHIFSWRSHNPPVPSMLPKSGDDAK